MKGREAKGAPSADLLVCFPSRAHLTLMPKTICSPARPSEANKRLSHHQQQQQHHLKKLSSKGGGHIATASPLMWATTKPKGHEISEPTSPKVTCAGQIKVRPNPGSCKSWQSVMEEIERIHNKRKKHKNKKPSWAKSIGFKKEIMQFLTCLRSIRFDLRCFGAFPQADITTEDEDEDQYQESNNHVGVEESDGNNDQNSRTVFSEWFMVLQENQNNCNYNEKEKPCNADDASSAAPPPAAPPPNALLLMRCKSAPAKSRFQDKAEEEEEEEENKDDDDHEEEEEVIQVKKTKNLKSLMEEEKTSNKENLVVMAYDTDSYKISSDIAKETWIVDGMKDLLSRSRSWKR